MLALSALLILYPFVAESDHQPVSTGVQDVELAVLERPTTTPLSSLHTELELYLKSKKSPLVDYVDDLLKQKNWKRIIAVSAIESTYCQHQLGYNCWGIKGRTAYRQYASYAEAISDAERVMEIYEGKTYEQMNGVYVQPASPNWLALTKRIHKELEDLERRTAQGIGREDSD